ncbi:MAG: hypothetical protein ACTSP4_00030 [Candidatus Hodarchaeales archaeon]
MSKLFQKVMKQKVTDKNLDSLPETDDKPVSLAQAIKQRALKNKKTREKKKAANPDLDYYVTKQSNFDGLLDKNETNTRFCSLFEKVLAQAGAAGNTFELTDGNLQHQHRAIKTSIIRPNPEHINELKNYINTVHNPSIEISGNMTYTHPDTEVMKIDPEGELCNKNNHHCSFDSETNVLQHLHETLIETKLYDPEGDKELSDFKLKIDGGIVGCHFLEAKRYIEFKVSSLVDYDVYANKDNSGHTIIVSGNNPLEALFIGSFEAILSQELLSSMQDGQKELISIFKELTANLLIPINADIMEDYLYHRTNMLYKGANLKFDINQLVQAHIKSKRKLDFVLAETEAKEINIQWGKVTETEEHFLKNFKVRMGNRTAGFKFKIRHNNKFGRDGKPELALSPAQTKSEKISYATDVRTLAHTCLYERADLGYISKGTAFEKKKEDMKAEDLQFWQKDFYLNQDPETQDFSFSKASLYLYYDCLSTLSGYGKLTHSLSLEPVEKKMDVSFDFLRKEKEPLSSLVISTASLSKQAIFAKLMKETGIHDLRKITRNIRNERFYFKDWIKITETFLDKEGEEVNRDIQLYFAGRIESMIYGQLKAIYNQMMKKYTKIIAPLDFKAEYPMCAWLTLAWKKLVLAAKGQLHTRQTSDIKLIEQRFWNAQRLILNSITNTGQIPVEPLHIFSGLLQVEMLTNLQIRSNKPEIMWRTKKERKTKTKYARKIDLLKKGNQFLTMAELSHSLFRFIETNPKTAKWSVERKITKMQSLVQFISGNTLLFENHEIDDYSEEFFTEINALRDLVREEEPTKARTQEQIDEEADKYKIIGNSGYGNLTEGVTKDDYAGKLYIAPATVDLTALARWLNNMLEIYAIKYKIKTLYQHTDSGYVQGTPEDIKKLQKTFELVDPLESDLEKKKAYRNKTIDWFGCWGKSKNAYHFIENTETPRTHKHSFKCTKDTCKHEWKGDSIECPECGEPGKSQCMKFTTHGSGVYSWRINASYLQLILDLYRGKTLTTAVKNAKKYFPLSYQLTIDKEGENIKNYKNILKYGKLIEVIPWKRGYVFVYYMLKEKVDKRGKTRRTREKLYVTTTELFTGKFGDITTIPVKKINMKELKLKKQLVKKIRILIKQARKQKMYTNWRGYSQLFRKGTVKEMQRCISNNLLINKYRTNYIPSRKSISVQALGYKDKFPKLSLLEVQHLIDLKHSECELGEFLDHADPSLGFEELKRDLLNNPIANLMLREEIVEEEGGINDDMQETILERIESELTDDHGYKLEKNHFKKDIRKFFTEQIDQYEIEFSSKNFEWWINDLLDYNHITEKEYNFALTQLNKLEPEKMNKRPYINPFPKGVNKIIFSKYLAGNQLEFIEDILEQSTTLTIHEKSEIERYVYTKYAGEQHLTKRFSFQYGKYERFLDQDSLAFMRNCVEQIKSKKKGKKDSKKAEEQIPNNLITKAIFEEQLRNHITLIPGYDGTTYKKGQELKDFSNDEHDSDGIRFSGSFRVFDFKFSPKTISDRNKSTTQAIINTARTLSCQWARTHSKNKKERDKRIHDYLFVDDPANLPIPKKRAIRSQNMRGGTIRAKMKFYPLFTTEPDSLVEKWIVRITLKNKLEKFLKKGVLIEENDKYFRIGKDDDDSRKIIAEIKKLEKIKYTTVDFYGRNWIVELKNYSSAEANAVLHIGIIVGSNHICNTSLRINIASDNLINYNLVPFNKSRLQEESHVLSQLVNTIMPTNTLACFSRNASLTFEDIQKKKYPNFLIDAVLMCLAQVLLENSAKNMSTQLDEFHITTDIETGDPEIAKTAIRLLNWSIEDVYETQARNIPDIAQEYNYRNNLSIGRARQGSCVAINSFKSRFADVSYHKGYTQFINKARRVFNMGKDNLPKSLMEEAKKVFSVDRGIIRAEKQLKSVKVVNDPFHYKMFKAWISLMKTAIYLAKKLLTDKNGFVNKFKQQVTELIEPVKEYLDAYIKKFYLEPDDYTNYTPINPG